MDWLAERFESDLEDRKSKHNHRVLKVAPDGLIDFVSNDYLGLSGSKKLHHRIMSRCAEVVDNGAGGSRLLSGNRSEVQALEKQLSKLFGSESSLLYNSGYQANQGLISAVAQKGDTIFYDVLSHVCIKEGIALSKASAMPFAHNDLGHLEDKLSRCETNKFIIVESIYSMDGDKAPLEGILLLARKYDARVIVDEAHGTGVVGHHGGGVLLQQGIEQQVFARIYTFGKAMGVHGACVCGSNQLINYLVNFSKPFIYTTALPYHSVVAIEESFKFLSENMWLQKVLKSKVDLFREACTLLLPEEVISESDSPIQPIIVPGNEKIKKVTKMLLKQGFDCRPILSPTVAKNKERLRICLHVHNSEAEIDGLVSNLRALL